MCVSFAVKPTATRLKRVFMINGQGCLLPGGGGGGGALPSNRLMGMCRWMGSHFHDWIDYNGVAFNFQ